MRQVVQAVGTMLPDEYLDLLRHSNGEGDLCLAPGWFVLSSVAEMIDILNDDFYREQFNGFLFFGGNGGLEMLAFDRRVENGWTIVMIDPIAGPESAETIAADFGEFVRAIGIECDDDLTPNVLRLGAGPRQGQLGHAPSEPPHKSC